MKKLLIGFLAVGLIMGFAMTASAQPNIKASGQLYMYGTYADAILLVNARNDIAWLLDALARCDQRCEDLAASLDETRAALDAASRKEDQ